MSVLRDHFTTHFVGGRVVHNLPSLVIPMNIVSHAGTVSGEYGTGYWVQTTLGMLCEKNTDEAAAAAHYEDVKQKLVTDGASVLDFTQITQAETLRRMIVLEQLEGIVWENQGDGNATVTFYPSGSREVKARASELEVTQDSLFNRFLQTQQADDPIAQTEIFQGHISNSIAHILVKPSALESINLGGDALCLRFNSKAYTYLTAYPNDSHWFDNCGHRNAHVRAFYEDNARTWYKKETKAILDRAVADIRAVAPNVPVDP